MQREYHFYVYILTNYSKTVFYVGFTNDIVRRVVEHKNGFGCKFTTRYKLKYLIYFEQTEDIYSAMTREKEIKKWRREKKLQLVRTINPNFVDLALGLFKDTGISKQEIMEITKELSDNYKQGNK